MNVPLSRPVSCRVLGHGSDWDPTRLASQEVQPSCEKPPGEVSGVEVRLMRAPSLTKAERLRNRAKTIGEQCE
jgi:hypothetical protein